MKDNFLIRKISNLLTPDFIAQEGATKLIPLYEKTLQEIYPKSPDLPCELICHYLTGKQIDKAEQLLKNAKLHYPNLKALEFLEAIIKTYAGDFKNATQLFNKLYLEETQNSTYQEFYYSTYICTHKFTKGNLEEFLSTWHQLRNMLRHPDIQKHPAFQRVWKLLNTEIHIFQLLDDLKEITGNIQQLAINIQQLKNQEELEPLYKQTREIIKTVELVNQHAQEADEMIAPLPIDRNENTSYKKIVEEITTLFFPDGTPKPFQFFKKGTPDHQNARQTTQPKKKSLPTKIDNKTEKEKYIGPWVELTTYSLDILRQLKILMTQEENKLKSTFPKDQRDIFQDFPDLSQLISPEKIGLTGFFNDIKTHITTENQTTKTEIIKKLKEPPDRYRTNYRIAIRRCKNKDGELIIYDTYINYPIKLSEVQINMLTLMAKNMKERDKDKSDLDRGWTTTFKTLKGKKMLSGFKRKEISKIREKIEGESNRKLSPDLIESLPDKTKGFSKSNASLDPTENPSDKNTGYRISTHPENITIIEK